MKPWVLGPHHFTRHSFCDVDSKNNNKKPWVLTPRVYNSIWISWTFIITALILFWVVKVTIEFSKIERLIIQIIQALNDAADAWDIAVDYSKLHVKEVLAMRDAVYKDLDILAKSVERFCGFLVVFSGVLALVSTMISRHGLNYFVKVQ